MKPISRQEVVEHLRDQLFNLWKTHSVMRLKPCLPQHDKWLLFSDIWSVVIVFSPTSGWIKASSLPQRLEKSTAIRTRRTIMPNSIAGVNSMAISESQRSFLMSIMWVIGAHRWQVGDRCELEQTKTTTKIASHIYRDKQRFKTIESCSIGAYC